MKDIYPPFKNAEIGDIIHYGGKNRGIVIGFCGEPENPWMIKFEPIQPSILQRILEFLRFSA